MSIPVELNNLADAVARYRFAYLLTSSESGAPRAVAVTPVLEDGILGLRGLGRRTQANAKARPEVGLVWPPESADDYSLIVDGTATVADDAMQIRPTRAVLHRPAPSPNPGASGHCTSDCVELGLDG